MACAHEDTAIYSRCQQKTLSAMFHGAGMENKKAASCETAGKAAVGLYPGGRGPQVGGVCTTPRHPGSERKNQGSERRGESPPDTQRTSAITAAGGCGEKNPHHASCW